MKRFCLLFVLLHFCILLSLGQSNGIEEYGIGLVFDDEAYEQVPEQVQMLTRDYVYLPPSFSLKNYCPTPKNQGSFGTCTSWATAYAARTIAEAIQRGWTDEQKITREAFSPSFIYMQIKHPYDYNCQNGSAISNAMYLMKYKGVPKMSQFNVDCATYIPIDIYNYAFGYRINDYFKLFTSDLENNVKIQKTKKALYESCPVVIGMDCYSSFSDAKDVWNGVRDNNRGGHAMCVVGYDDNKYGGAFLIMNSWGTNWGNGGFTWVRYSDFVTNVHYAYALYVPYRIEPKPSPAPVPPAPTSEKPTLTWNASTTCNSADFTIRVGVSSKSQVTNVSVVINGSQMRGVNSVVADGYSSIILQDVKLREGDNKVEVSATNSAGTTKLIKTITCSIEKLNEFNGNWYVQLSTGEKMKVTQSATSFIPAYKAEGSYISGTRYRIYISNNEPAYVYVIASDMTNNYSKVFPPKDNISPALLYRSNSIALPDEKWYMEMDNTTGTDYLCVLYCKEALDIDAVMKKISSSNGSIYDRLHSVFGAKLVKKSDASLSFSDISFTAKSKGTVLPVVLQIKHD